MVIMQPQQTWTNPQLSGTYVMLSSNNGLFRFWNVQGIPGNQEVLTTSLAGWVLGPEAFFGDVGGAF